jgi:hypothetical protein
MADRFQIDTHEDILIINEDGKTLDDDDDSERYTFGCITPKNEDVKVTFSRG